jgi:hypothetical protein
MSSRHDEKPQLLFFDPFFDPSALKFPIKSQKVDKIS